MQPLLRSLASLVAVTLAAASASAQSAAAPATRSAPAPAPPPATGTAPPPVQAGPPPAGSYPYPYGRYPYSPYPYAYPRYPAPTARPTPKPRVLPYHEGQRIPAGYYLEDSIHRGAAIAGAAVLGGPYATSIAFAAGYNFDNKSGWLALPALGPFITMATRHNVCPANATDTYSNCTDDQTVRTLLVLDGIAQSAGAVLLIWALESHEKRLVREDAGYLVVMPTRVGSGYGLGVAGDL